MLTHKLASASLNYNGNVNNERNNAVGGGASLVEGAKVLPLETNG